MSELVNCKDRLSRRRFLRLLGLASGGLALAACAPTAPKVEDQKTKQPTAIPPTAEPVSIEWYVVYGTWGEVGVKPIAENAVKEIPGIKEVKISYGGESSQGALEALLARISADTPPDVATMWDSPVSLGVRGALTDLTPMMPISQYSAKENWPEMMMRSCEFGGKTYGFPTFNAIYSYMYNMDALESKGMSSKREDFPKTWDELRALSKEFTKFEGDVITNIGYAPLWDYMTDMFMQFNGGGSYDWVNGKIQINREPNIQTLEYARKWIDEEFQGKFESIRATGWDFVESSGGGEPAFSDGRLIVISAGNFQLSMFEWAPPKSRCDFAPYALGPGGDPDKYSTYWGNWFMIPKGTKEVDHAFKFVDWINGDGVVYWITAGNPDTPGNKRYYDKHADKLPQRAVDTIGKEKTKYYLDFFAQLNDHVVDIFASPISSFQADQLARAAERVMKGVAPASEALNEAQVACELELKKAIESAL